MMQMEEPRRTSGRFIIQMRGPATNRVKAFVDACVVFTCRCGVAPVGQS
jgi:hypothetical protein